METFEAVIQDAGGGGAYVEIDLATALAAAGLRETFDSLSYSHRREHVNAVLDAKKPETRVRRIAKTLEMLRSA
jgi:uncharacterized protein YdeI (YjbR/CyaY-like superfamily)